MIDQSLTETGVLLLLGSQIKGIFSNIVGALAGR
jgi:hypothetical protein